MPENKKEKILENLKITLFVLCFGFSILLIVTTVIMNIIASTQYHFNNLDKIKNALYENSPLFEFNIGQKPPSSEFVFYKEFYKWQGTTKRKGSARNRRTVQDIQPVQINIIYQNKFYYKNINKTYFDYLNDSVKQKEDCKENYKKCGILDSKNNILCLPIDEECPLNDFILSQEELPDLIPEYSEIKVTESLTDSIKYIYYTNNKTNNKIITHFELSGNNPCIIPDEHNWIAVYSREKEKTCNCKTYINGTLYDQNYREVGNKILMKTLYYDNSIPIYKNFNNEMVNLYVRNYYYIDKQCMEKFVSDFDDLENYYISKFLTFRICQYIQLVTFFIYLYCFWKHDCISDYDERKKRCDLIITEILSLYWVIINIIILIFISRKEKNFLCGEYSINTKINNIFDNEFSFTVIKVFDIINLVLSIFIAIGNLFIY